ncbi:tetratricopeptide repeat protein [Asanoa sp. WMMD1127]|uniref:tetratricopeptide repeat protein n=1 Tax=Asanoa sp. WMMD1127 TaxID=3016107 RepID=UPI0024175A12|nr:tetratricopeptide repeat protein [Asanoa sp. WMMD1127]MDG4822460.1 tetratricopeptide repeat protein [Asanoa sp. WMMD1127]
MDAESAEGHLRRAELLADLGHFDEAVAELDPALTADPGDGATLALLAAIQLAAGRPEPALAAAERAVAATPAAVAPQVTEGEALLQLRRFKEAAAVAERILDAGPDDPYAQLHGAALLGEARNGQRALDAAWQAVALAPQDARAHLVLSGIADRLQLTDLAEQARDEAMRLDPDLASTTGGSLGRYTVPEPKARDLRPTAETAIGWLALYAGAFTVPAAMLAAVLHAVHPGTSRVVAIVLGLCGLGLVALFAARLPGSPRETFRRDRASTVAGGATIAGPLCVIAYGIVGSPWAVAVALAATAVAAIAVVSRIRF